jgi:hypothetical protein
MLTGYWIRGKKRLELVKIGGVFLCETYVHVMEGWLAIGFGHGWEGQFTRRRGEGGFESVG